jgi:putative nucleotidyltransferase with HDIG domain
VIAEHVRERAKLSQLWIFARAQGAEAQAEIDEVAHASAGEAGIPPASARVIALEAVGGRRRFEPRTVTFEAGVHVVAGETSAGRLLLVIAAGPSGDSLRAEAERALVELTDIAARVLADDPAPYPRQADRPVAAGAPESPAQVRPAAYGSGLAEALSQLRRPPILDESRLRLAQELGQRHPAVGAAVRTIETDAGLALAVLAAANGQHGKPRDGYASVPDALAALGPHATLRLVEELPAVQRGGDRLATAFRRLSGHAIATRAAADLIARQVGDPKADVLRAAALLHDVGKVTLAASSPHYLAGVADAGSTPEERIVAERRRLGIDHATIGAVAVRRLGLPKSLATAIERHHSSDASGPAAIVRLADMLAHDAYGDAVAAPALTAAGRAFRLDAGALQRIAYDLPRVREQRDVTAEPSPLTPMQQRVLGGLARGFTYKQIAADLSVSESTVRTHLHNLYGKLEVSDRAQAVLLAAERGWI